MQVLYEKNYRRICVIFGYVWKDPRAIDEKTQRQYLADAGPSDRFVKIEKSPSREWRRDLAWGDRDLGKGEKPKPLLREGDVLAVYRTRYLADDSLDFVAFLCRLAALRAGLHVVGEGVTVFPDADMTRLIEQDLAERRKKQTEEGRKALSKLPKSKRGGAPRTEDGWDEETRKKFRKMWVLPPSVCSNREIARTFDVKAPTVPDIAARMKLPPRGA